MHTVTSIYVLCVYMFVCNYMVTICPYDGIFFGLLQFSTRFKSPETGKLQNEIVHINQ